MRASNIKRLTATGDVTTEDSYLRAVILTAGTGAAAAVIRSGGSGGTHVATIKADTAALATSGVNCWDAFCGGGIHVTLTGTNPEATFVYA